jgi:hypothetical protein
MSAENTMKLTIRCLTDGVIINGQTLRATQVVELDDADDALVLSLKIKQAAGDIVVEGLPVESVKTARVPLDSLKDSSK